MSRKLELLRMMLNSLMADMGEDEKLSFLTDAFLLTEDLRHEISYGDTPEEEMQGNKTVVIPSESQCDRHCDHCREGGSDAVNAITDDEVMAEE